MKMNPAVKFSLPAILALALVFLAGCTTTPPVDWNSRVGTYTYDQAVTDLGPPDRQTKQSDGKSVYKWFVRAHTCPGPNTGMSYYGETGFSANQTAGVINNRMLQLTFDPDGKLVTWTKNY